MEDNISFQDIMPMENISIDYSGYILFFISFCIVVMVLFYLIKIVRNRRKTLLSKEEIILQELKNLDLNSLDTKQLCYDFTLFTKELGLNKNDTKLQEIFTLLEPYKYHNKMIPLEPKIKTILQRYIDELVV